MDSNAFLTEVRRLLVDLLGRKLGGKEFVRQFDDLMADEWPSEMDRSKGVWHLLDEYHIEFAMFVEDPEMREEWPDYYGYKQLECNARALLEALS